MQDAYTQLELLPPGLRPVALEEERQAPERLTPDSTRVLIARLKGAGLPWLASELGQRELGYRDEGQCPEGSI